MATPSLLNYTGAAALVGAQVDGGLNEGNIAPNLSQRIGRSATNSGNGWPNPGTRRKLDIPIFSRGHANVRLRGDVLASGHAAFAPQQAVRAASRSASMGGSSRASATPVDRSTRTHTGGYNRGVSGRARRTSRRSSSSASLAATRTPRACCNLSTFGRRWSSPTKREHTSATTRALRSPACCGACTWRGSSSAPSPGNFSHNQSRACSFPGDGFACSG